MTTRTIWQLSALAVMTFMLIGLSACAKEPVAATITAADLVARIDEGTAPAVFDVRTPEEYAAGHVPGAINIPHDALPDRVDELSVYQDMEVVVYCRSGKRAGIAEAVLTEAGFTNVRDLEGHMLQWEAEAYPVDQISESN